MRTVATAPVALIVLVLVLVLGAAACQPQRTITVLAAASLTDAFDEIIAGYGADRPGARIRVSYGSSATLAGQVTSGAPADVFASADEATMAALTTAGLQVSPRALTTNRLQIAVPPDNPGEVVDLRDFAREELRIALCDTEAPCGAAAQTLFATYGVTPRPDTYQADVKATLRTVELGEVDAALVYRTDVLASGDRVRGLATPHAPTAVNQYLVTALPGASAEASRFVEHLLSPAGQRVLTRYGFGDG